jgi:hypothetical protein
MFKVIGAVVLGLLLAVPDRAAAECAWVLWTNTWIRGQGAEWSPEEAFTTQAACRTKLDERLAIPEGAPYGAESGGVVVKRPDAVLDYPPGADKDKPTRIWTYRCLPDTVDPRRPKGGG